MTGTITAADAIDGLTAPNFKIATDAVQGAATIDAATGVWTYTPADNYNGVDSFTVSVTDDDGNTAVQVVSLVITQVDDAASFGGDVTGSTAEGVAVTGTITAADAIDGLTAPNFKIATDAVQGAATIDAATGVWTYTPADNYNGVDSFTVSVTDDDGNTAVQVVSLVITQVDDAASFGGDVTGSTAEGVAVTGTITAADAIDGLTAPNFKIATDAVQGAATIDAATGVWTYTPADNYNGVDSFTVSVTDDDGNTAVQVVSLVITQVDDAASFGGDVTGSTAEGVAVTGTITAADAIDGLTAPNFKIATDAVQGAATIDAATGVWTYTPADNYNGVDSFTVSVTDDDGNTAVQVVSLVITQVDDAASFGGDVTGSTAEGVAVTGTITAADAIDGLTAPNFKIATDAVQGAATIDAATGVWTYTPADNYNGVDSFTVSVTDDDGNTAVQVVSLVITQVDDAASFGGDVTGSTAEGVAVTGTITAADAIDGLTAPNFKIATDAVQGAATIDAATGVWTYTPADNYNGVDSFTVSVTDDDGNTAVQVVSLVITQVDDAASFGGDVTGSTAEGVAVTGTITAADAIDGLTAPNFKIATDAVQGAATIDAATGVWTYTPADNYNGVDSFTVSVTDDDGNTAVQVVSLTITQVEKPLFKIQSPMLGSLTYGVATLFLMESGGFSTDGRLMLVKATYTDNGEAGNKLRYAYFLYDVDDQQYLYSLNERLFGQQAREYDVKEAVISGVEENFRILAQTREKSSAQEQLVLLDNSGILSSDLFQPILGAPIEPNIEKFLMSSSGRFIAIQTTNAQLAPDTDLDTNDVSDIYLIDLLANDIHRISFIGGAETNDPANLASILEIGSTIRIGMISAAPYVSPSKIDTNSVNPSNSELQRSDLYLSETTFSTDGPSGVSTFTLISKTPDGIASGWIDTDYLVFDTSNSIFFNSRSVELSDDDENSENDGFRLIGNEIELISAASVTSLALGAQIVSVSADGQNLLALTTSPELVTNSVQQLVLFDFSKAQERVISVSEGMALSDGWVISGVISPDGGRIAFTSDATNLVSGDSITTSGDLYLKVRF